MGISRIMRNCVIKNDKNWQSSIFLCLYRMLYRRRVKRSRKKRRGGFGPGDEAGGPPPPPPPPPPRLGENRRSGFARSYASDPYRTPQVYHEADAGTIPYIPNPPVPPGPPRLGGRTRRITR